MLPTIGYDAGIHTHRCGEKSSNKILEWPQIVRALRYIAYETQIFPLDTNFKSRIKYFQRYNSSIILKVKITKQKTKQATVSKRAEAIKCRRRMQKLQISELPQGVYKCLN